MGAFKIQTDLDLSGFNLLNFCIQSYTDLENVPNLGLGRKLFFTGNSTDEKNLREVIWNGVEWKAAAYLDDIEAITNGEGSLGVRVKALEDMLGLEDVTDVIDTWNDVKAFFANVDEGLDLMTMLNGKAEWAERIPDLSFKHIGYGYAGQGFWTSGPALSFGANANYFGQIQMDIMPVPTIKIRSYNEGYGEWQTLLHTGNIGDYALKTDGSNKMEAPLKLFSGNISTVNHQGLFVGTANISDGAAFNYGAFISIPDRGMSQLQLSWYRSYHSPQLAIRLHESNTWGDWKTIAFTDSDITGNAATATKLANAVSLWGNTFDGTQSLDATITFKYGSAYLRGKTSEGDVFTFAKVNEINELLLGQGTAQLGASTVIYGNKIIFSYGSAGSVNQTAMTITEEGHVLIGASTVPNENYCWLHLNKRGHFGTAISSYTLGMSPRYGLTVGNVNEYGLYLYTTANLQSNIQVGRFDGTATAYALNLNPLGGAVNIGSADGATNVLGHIFASKDLYMNGFLMMNRGKEGIYLSGSSINWHNTNNAWSNTLLTFAKDLIKVHQLANFSNRVTIGAVEDDGTYKLQVLGGIKAYSGEGHAVRLNNGNVSLGLIGSTTASVAKGLYFNFDGTYVGGLVAFHSKGTFQYLYLGDNTTTPWFRINSTESNFNVLTKFNGGALIPTGQKMTFGADGPTMEYDADANAIKVTGNIYATGTMASGGKADAEEGDTGGGGNANVYSDVLEGVITQEWEVGNPFQKEDVIVSLYMWNTDESRWEMVLADIGVTSENIWVTFGRPTSTTDKYMAVVMG